MRKIPRRKTTKKQREYQKKYTQKLKTYNIRFNPENELDSKLIEKLESQENKTIYIKNLIEKDL